MDLSDLSELFAAAEDAAQAHATIAALKRAGALEALLGRLPNLLPELSQVFGAPAFDAEELTVLLLAPAFGPGEAANLAAAAAAHAPADDGDDTAAAYAGGDDRLDPPYAPDREPPGAAPALPADWPAQLLDDLRLDAFREGFQLGRLTLVAGELPGEWRQTPAGAYELHLARDVAPAETLQALAARERAICEALGWTGCTLGVHGHVLTVHPPAAAHP